MAVVNTNISASIAQAALARNERALTAAMEQLSTGGSYPDVDTTGITAGLGYSIEAAEGISVRAEVQAYQYDDVSAANATDGTKTITITDMMSANAKLSIVKSF